MTSQGRRRLWLIAALIWLGPGAIASLILRESVAWVNFQSWLALVIAFFSCRAAETPVEIEDAK